MKILIICADYLSGCYYYRTMLPSEQLIKLGHEVKLTPPARTISKELLDWPDLVLFSRSYNFDLSEVVSYLQNRKKPIIYETDDDLERLLPTNPAKPFIDAQIDSIKLLAKSANIIFTATDYLADRLAQRYHKKVEVLPNAVDFNRFGQYKSHSEVRKIGWSGSVTHAVDLLPVIEALKNLQKKHHFQFVFQGFVRGPIDSEMYEWEVFRMTQEFHPQREFFEAARKMWEGLQQLNYVHIPWYTAIMMPPILSHLELDIGLCPLLDDEFNRCKSCVKAYEYAATGAVTLASNVIPYNAEFTYLAENNSQDWEEKLEYLIYNSKFREQLLEKQRDWVYRNRNIEVVGKLWEKTFKKYL